MSELADLFVSSYRPWVRRRLEAIDAGEPPGLTDALDSGEAWLRRELDRLLDLPFDRQPRGPLEIFQEAMRFPTDALAAAGVPEVERDEVARRALPGDRYDLAPPSSQLLGEEVWRSHLAWGARKAAALRGIIGES